MTPVASGLEDAADESGYCDQKRAEKQRAPESRPFR
jgi:hypothetical protein